MNTTVTAPSATTKTLLETRFFKVVDRNGYIIVQEPKAVNGVVVIPLLPNGQVLLASLNRKAIGQMSIEFPRGKIDDGESALEAGARELLEETGMQAITIKELGQIHSNTSLIASAVSICLANVDGTVTNETDGEVDTTMIRTIDELKTMVTQGDVTDGHTLSALALLLCQMPS